MSATNQPSRDRRPRLDRRTTPGRVRLPWWRQRRVQRLTHRASMHLVSLSQLLYGHALDPYITPECLEKFHA
jgi:hypothetical protein